MDNRLLECLDGRTKQWLADKTGIHRNTLQSYFKGVAPPLDNAYKISDALGKSLEYIWPRHNEMTS